MQLPPLVSPGHLLHRNLLLLNLPPSPHYSLSPSLFSHPNPKALIDVLHHLLHTLPSLPLPYPRFLSSCLSSLLPALSLCYPTSSPSDCRDFHAAVFPALVALEEWTERRVLPPAPCASPHCRRVGGTRLHSSSSTSPHGG